MAEEVSGDRYSRIYQRLQEMLEAGQVEFPPADSWSPMEAHTVDPPAEYTAGHWDADNPTWEDATSIAPFTFRDHRLRMGPDAILLIHPADWHNIRDEMKTNRPQTLNIGGQHYDVHLTPHIPVGEIIAINQQDLGFHLPRLTRQVEDIRQQVEELTESMGRIGRLMRFLGELYERLRPYIPDGDGMPDYYDKQDIGYVHEEPQFWQPVFFSRLHEQLNAVSSDEHGVLRYLEFNDHVIYPSGFYFFRRSEELQMPWRVCRITWEGPPFCRISAELLEAIGVEDGFRIYPGDEIELYHYTLKAIRFDLARMSILAKQVDSRWSRVIFWAEYYYVKLQHRWHRVRYRR